MPLMKLTLYMGTEKPNIPLREENSMFAQKLNKNWSMRRVGDEEFREAVVPGTPSIQICAQWTDGRSFFQG